MNIIVSKALALAALLSFAPALCAEYILVTSEIPPYTMRGNAGDPQGIIIDILRSVEMDGGQKSTLPPVVFLPWPRAQAMVKGEDRLDKDIFIFPVGRTSARELHYEWVFPMLEDHMVLFGLEGENFFQAELIKKRVGVLTNSSALHTLQEEGFTKIFECRTVTICARMLFQKRFDAWLAPRYVAYHAFEKLGFSKERIIEGPQLKEMIFYFAGNKSINKMLVHQWQLALEKIRSSSVYHEILSKYNPE